MGYSLMNVVASRSNSLAALSVGASMLVLVLVDPAVAQTAVSQQQSLPQGNEVPVESSPATPPANTPDGTISGSTDIQDATAQADQNSTNDIVVTGIRASLENSQSIKREANTVVDAITAEDIGALPDRSVTEALQRIPGVAISRFLSAGDPDHFAVEGGGVVIRGLSYVRGEFNGRDTFAANGGRQIGFNDVPSELLGSVEVFKNLTAEQIEGGIAGTVNLNTRKPFDSNEDLIYLSADMNYGDFVNKGSPSLSGLFSKTWDTGIGRIGVLGSLSYSQILNRADGIQVTAYQTRTADEPDATRIPGLQPGIEYVVPIGGAYRTQEFDRRRRGQAAALQWESPDETMLATLQYLRTDATLTWGERTFEAGSGSAIRNTFPRPGTTYEFDDDNVFTGGVISQFEQGRPGGPNIPETGLNHTMANRGTDNRTVTTDYGANFKWAPSDRLRFNFDGQFVKSTNRNADFVMNTVSYADVALDVTGDLPDQQLLAPDGRPADVYYTDPFRTHISNAMDYFNDSDGEQWSFRADGEFDFGNRDDGFFDSVKFGARYADRDQTVRSSAYNWAVLSEVWGGTSPVFYGDIDSSKYETFAWPDFFRGKTAAPPNALFWRTNIALDYENAARDFVAINDLWSRPVSEGGKGANIAGWRPLSARPGVIEGTPFLPSEVYVNSETTKAAYIQLNFGQEDLDWLGGIGISGNVGVRYVRTLDKSVGGLTFPTNILGGDASIEERCDDVEPDDVFCNLDRARQEEILRFSNGTSVPNTARNEFDHWLPSVNLKADLTSELIGRFAYSKAISRPDFGQLVNFVNVSPRPDLVDEFTFQASSGNPFLEPVEADQFDLTLEYYFDRVGSITGALFYKKLSNIIVSDLPLFRTLENNGVTEEVLILGPSNASDDGDVKGFEVAYQQFYNFLPGMLSGFGLQANYTFVESSGIPNATLSQAGDDTAEGRLPLQGLSKHNYNLALLYEKQAVSARLAYSWRSEYLIGVRDIAFPNRPVFNAPTGQLDASFIYTVSDNFKIGIQAQNLLDEITETRTIVNDEGMKRPRSYFINDRRFSLTTRMRF